MIMYGTHLLSAADELRTMKLQEICEMIRQPNDFVLAMIARLRAVINIDATKYSQMKKELPYFVCGIFTPKFRKQENFAYIEYFVIDIDHITEKGLDIAELARNMSQDKRAHLCFVSPSGNGLKIVFRLKERCYDAGKFAMFYRAFAHQFAQQYQLEQVVDTRTCDVTRACFLSYDPAAYFNAEADGINMKDFVSEDDIEDAFAQDYNLLHQPTKTLKTETEILPNDPDSDTLQQIKLLLGQQKALLAQKATPVYVPDALNEIIDDLKLTIEKTGIEVVEIRDIQYGKKIRSRLGIRTSEINLFYGKKGFSVVKSPKRGCSAELNDVMADLLTCYFQITTK